MPGKTPCLRTHTRDELLTFGQRSLLCSVIRLTIFISESLDEVRPFTQNDAWGALFKRHSDEGGPTGMDAKANSDLLHITPPELSGHVANLACDPHISKRQH